MKISKIIKRTFVSSVSFAALDSVWLGLIMNDYYKEHLGSLARRNGENLDPDWTAVVLVYVLLVVGVNVFAVSRKTGVERISDSMLRGALFGLVTYGIYDLTNMATLDGWSWQMAAVDMLWGAALCSIVSAVTSAAVK